MKIILTRGKMNSGKTTTAKLVYDDLAKKATVEYLFDHYNMPIKAVVPKSKTEVHDFKAVLQVNGAIIVIITAGDEPAKLMKNIEFLIEFVLNTFGMAIDTLICCGRSQNRQGSVYLRLKELYPNSELTVVLMEWTDDETQVQNLKLKTANKILVLL